MRGLRIESGDTYAGLFGIVYGDEKQSIENLTVKGSIECGEKIAYAGGIVAYMHGKMKVSEIISETVTVKYRFR